MLAPEQQSRALARSRPMQNIVVLGANGTMGAGAAALFTATGAHVTLLARSKAKADAGLDAACAQVRSPTVRARAKTGGYEDALAPACAKADFIFEALAEDAGIKRTLFDAVEEARRKDAIVATVTSGLSINALAKGRGDSFRQHFLGLHLFNPPNAITGTELIPGEDCKPEVADFMEAYAREMLGREIIRANDTPAFAGNRVGFKLLNECAQLAAQLNPLLVERIVGPYTGRALTPLATIDLVGWDIHRAIVDNIHTNTKDEAHATLALPNYMARLMQQGVLGNKSGGGFFKREGETRLVLQPATGEYQPEAEARAALPAAELNYINEVARLHSQGRYQEGLALFLRAPGRAAAAARKVVAGYISYALHRAGEVAQTLHDIDSIMAHGFNWAPPSLLVRAFGAQQTRELIAEAELPLPNAPALESVARESNFAHPRRNPGKYFVAA